jgi:hypothetical protein
VPTISSLYPRLPDGPVRRATPARRLLSASVVVLLAAGGLGLTGTAAQADPGDGAVRVWGAIDPAEVPASLTGKDVIAIDALDGHQLALTSDGHVTAWGNNDSGQTDVPMSLADQTVTAVEAGCTHSLALTSDGQVTAWGNNDNGQTDVPVSLQGKTVTDISAGCSHNLALTSDGHVTAWGSNNDGQGVVPEAVADETLTKISAGLGHNLAVTTHGRVLAWGNAGLANLPASLATGTVTDVAAGWFHSIALTADGQIIAWGDNSRCQRCVPSLAGKTVTRIEAGVWHSLALTSAGEALAWGHNGQNQLYVPAIPSNMMYTAVAVGHLHSVGVVAPRPLDFETGTTASIPGRPVVGQTLTADGGEVAPAPTSHTYRWLADGSPISGANGRELVLTPGEQGAAITVEVTSVKHGYNSSTDTSDATSRVAGVTVVGTTTVGRTLRGDSSAVTPEPPATLTKQWLRDGTPIPGAENGSYVLTNADAGSRISYVVTAVADGHSDAPVTSAEVGPVSGGVITLPTPVVSGTPVVDGTLTAALPDGQLDPADVDVTWQWFRGETRVGTGNLYAPEADDVGAPLTVRANATKDYFNRVSESVDTPPVGRATFGAAPVATIAGTIKVGEVLTAHAGTITPAPDGLAHQWYADGDPIDGATGPTYTLGAAQKHAAITVEVTASRAGYEDASDLSSATAAVTTQLAPDLQLDAADPTLRRGESTMLTWSSTDAEMVAASGGWTGLKPDSGAASVQPPELGATTYVLAASNANGTTTTQVTVEVTRAAKALVVSVPRRLHLAGSLIKVSSSGLEPAEPYTVRIGGTQVAAGTASSAGSFLRSVTVPSRTKDGGARVTVTGSESDRAGATSTRVVTSKTLGLRVARHYLRVKQRQRVVVTGLAAGEKVLVSYQGKRVSARAARADAKGVYRVAFAVGRAKGAKVIKVVGEFRSRTATKAFWVRRR